MNLADYYKLNPYKRPNRTPRMSYTSLENILAQVIVRRNSQHNSLTRK